MLVISFGAEDQLLRIQFTLNCRFETDRTLLKRNERLTSFSSCLSTLSPAVSGTRPLNQTSTGRHTIGVADSFLSPRAYAKTIISDKRKEEFHLFFVSTEYRQKNVFMVSEALVQCRADVATTGLNQEGMLFDSLAAPGGYKQSADEPSPTLVVHFLSLVRLQLPPGIIRCRCQLHGEIKELLRLTEEEQVVREDLDRGHCTSQLGGGGTNHRTGRQVGSNKVTRFRLDLVGLGQFQLQVEAGQRCQGSSSWERCP